MEWKDGFIGCFGIEGENKLILKIVKCQKLIFDFFYITKKNFFDIVLTREDFLTQAAPEDCEKGWNLGGQITVLP